MAVWNEITMTTTQSHLLEIEDKICKAHNDGDEEERHYLIGLREGILLGQQSERERTLKILQDYEKLTENADEYTCGCGCNTNLTLVHEQLQRHIIDIKREVEKVTQNAT